jgi:hypothetical protein
MQPAFLAPGSVTKLMVRGAKRSTRRFTSSPLIAGTSPSAVTLSPEPLSSAYCSADRALITCNVLQTQAIAKNTLFSNLCRAQEAKRRPASPSCIAIHPHDWSRCNPWIENAAPPSSSSRATPPNNSAPVQASPRPAVRSRSRRECYTPRPSRSSAPACRVGRDNGGCRRSRSPICRRRTPPRLSPSGNLAYNYRSCLITPLEALRRDR